MTFQMPFNAVSLPMLSIKINRGVYKAPPSTYSSDIRNLLKKCLTVNPDKRPSIDEILKLPLIKNRINNFLKEVQYDQDLHTTIAKKYKEERNKLKHKYKIVNKDKNKNDNEIKTNDNLKQNNQINNSNKNDTIKMDEIKINEKNNNNNSAFKEKNDNKRMESDKNKVGAFFKNKKSTRKKEVSVPNSSNTGNNIQPKENNLNQKLNNNLNETNFLIQKKDSNFIQGKKYTEDEINKKIKEKGYKDLLNEKNGNLDVEKMNEDQYNQLRLLNNLHKIANNLEQDSDNELSVSSSMASSSNANEENENILIDTSNLKEDKNKNEIKENKEIYKEEKKEIENIQKENEKEIGQDLVKDVLNLLDKYCDKNLVQFDRKLIENKIQELKMKGYEQNKLEKAKEKIDEIFAILMKEKIM